MADSVASFVIDNLIQLLKDESEFLFGVDDELKSLTVQLGKIRSFLEKYERAHLDHKHNKSGEELVGKIRDLAYEAEDFFDNYIASAMERKRRDKLGKIIHSFSKLTTKHNVGKEIDVIRKKMEKIHDDSKMLNIDCEERPCLSKRSPPIVEEDDVVGLDKEAKNLVKWLLEGEDSLAVKSIVGIGGIGKTTLAKKVYNNFEVKKHFERRRAWVSVSKECNHTELLLDVINYFRNVTDQMKEMEDDELGKLLCDCLKSKRYLIVLDDVSDTKLLKYLKQFFPDDKNGSRVLITTRSNAEVSDATRSNAEVSDAKEDTLGLLSPGESWELLRKRAFRNKSGPPELEVLGWEIAQKCCGLPLAIAVLGGVLYTKGKTMEEWHKASTDVSSFLSEGKEDSADPTRELARTDPEFLNHAEEECPKILAYSYNDLPSRLKCCFLYFAVYPEDFEIHAKQLIRLWVAEGLAVVKDVEGASQTVEETSSEQKKKYVEETSSEPKNTTMEETAKCNLDDLVDRGLIQVIKRRSDGGVKTCAIQDLLRDLCISKAKKEKFLQFQHGNVACETQSISPSPRRLAGNSSVMRYIYSNQSSMKELRSVLCFTEDVVGFKAVDCLTSIFKSFQFIKVLNLDGVAVDALPEEIGGLYLLKYLGLGKTSITSLPLSICKLLLLQTLSISSGFIETAPSGIWKMTKLRHVYFKNQTLLPAPSNDDKLENLQTLTTICPSSCTVGVLSKLPNLVQLGVFGDFHSHVDDLRDGLVQLEHLKSLKLKRPGTVPPLPCLPSKFPENLIKVTLCDTELKEDPMEQLGKLELKKLQILKLTNKSFVGPKLTCLSGKFPSLEVLKIMNLQQHKFKLEMEGALPKLQSLVVHDCYGLQNLPEELWNLSNLRVVDVSEPSEPLRKVLQQQRKFEVKDGYKIHVYPPEKQ